MRCRPSKKAAKTITVVEPSSGVNLLTQDQSTYPDAGRNQLANRQPVLGCDSHLLRYLVWQAMDLTRARRISRSPTRWESTVWYVGEVALGSRSAGWEVGAHLVDVGVPGHRPAEPQPIVISERWLQRVQLVDKHVQPGQPVG
jgi:hypothetical protein